MGISNIFCEARHEGVGVAGLVGDDGQMTIPAGSPGSPPNLGCGRALRRVLEE